MQEKEEDKDVKHMGKLIRIRLEITSVKDDRLAKMSNVSTKLYIYKLHKLDFWFVLTKPLTRLCRYAVLNVFIILLSKFQKKY